jgi:hypothetical protein
MAKERCYYCGVMNGRFMPLHEYVVQGMSSIFACERCETVSNWNAVFLKDEGDVNQRHLGGLDE